MGKPRQHVKRRIDFVEHRYVACEAVDHHVGDEHKSTPDAIRLQITACGFFALVPNAVAHWKPATLKIAATTPRPMPDAVKVGCHHVGRCEAT
jgi:hypothetical protein